MNPSTTVGDYLALLNARIDQRQALWIARRFDEAVRLGLAIERARNVFKGGCFGVAHQMLMEAVS